MASKMFHFENISVVDGDMRVNIDLSRFSRQFQEAQFWLDSQVMTDMVPLMPMQTATLINLTRAKSAALAGTGRVCAAAGIYGRFQYMGKVMADSETGKGPMHYTDKNGNEYLRFRKGAKLIATDRNLTYSRASAVPRWFDEAKRLHGESWVAGVKKRAGGG